MPSKKKKQPLSVTHPDLAKQWHHSKNGILTPADVSFGSEKVKIWWLCEKDHEYQAVVSQRSRGSGCPVCAGYQILIGFNDLATTNPKLAAQWHPTKNGDLTPQDVTSGKSEKAWWLCAKGHDWQAVISSRSTGVGCPYCAGKKVFPGFNDIATTHPEVSAFWDYSKNISLSPKDVSMGSSKKVYWLCSMSHSFYMTVSGRVSGKNCPYCANNQVLPGFNDLLTRAPHLASEWDYEKNGPINPREIAPAATKPKYWWLCSEGHSWEAPTSNRVSGGAGCPYCSGHRAIIGETNLATLRPDLFKEIIISLNNHIDLDQLSVASETKIWWQCELNHHYLASVGNRSIGGGGCPYCSGHKVLLGFNDLATVNPSLVEEWDFEKNLRQTPQTVSASSNKIAFWKCSEGHEWKTSLNNRTRGTGCPTCAGNTLTVGVNDLASTNPLLASEWDFEKNSPLTPDQVAQFNKTKVWWHCPNGHSFQANIANRGNGTGCPTCSKTGFDPNQDGYLYFLKHPLWEMFQIGITNVPDDRLNRHRRLGWKVIEVRGPMDGYLTEQWETAILRMLRAKGADLANSEIAGKFDGFSEAWSKSTFAVNSIKELMRLTERFEGN